jgi:outer membrane protein assembly factor BamB
MPLADAASTDHQDFVVYLGRQFQGTPRVQRQKISHIKPTVSDSIIANIPMTTDPVFQRTKLAAWLTGASLLLAFHPAVLGADWPNYRGPEHNGISNETDWRAEWGETAPKVLWRASVGSGSSSVVTAAGRAYTMGNRGEEESKQEDSVYCFDAATGKVIWTHAYRCPRLPKYYEGGTLSTPTIDGDVVFTLSKLGDLFCFDAASGKVIWEQQLNQKLGFALPTWHFSASPLVAGDRLILNMGSAGAALDKRTGKLIWENGKEACGYASPVPATIGGVECVVICGADSILGVRITDGEVLWRYPFFNKHKATTADAIVAGDEVFASSSYGRGCAKIRVSGNEVTQVFDNTVMRNLQSCSVLWQGDLYGFDETLLKCIAFKDAREQWSAKGMGKGSLSMCADGRMLVMSDTGELVFARANPKAFDVIARAQVLPRSTCRTAPVLSNGLIYLRNGKGDLVCLDARK